MEKTKNVMSPSRIVLFGGSFDPVHCGHLKVAYCALDQAGMDRVIFLPASQAPLKQKPFSSDRARLEMLRLALGDEVKFELGTYEIERNEISYTVNTVDYFKQLYGNSELFLLIGEDQFTQLNKWHRIDELVQMISFLVYPRGNERTTKEPSVPGVRHHILKAEKLFNNSTEVRERCRVGKALTGLVPDAVEAFIHEKGLYR